MEDWIYDFEELHQIEHTGERSQERDDNTPLNRPYPQFRGKRINEVDEESEDEEENDGDEIEDEKDEDENHEEEDTASTLSSFFQRSEHHQYQLLTGAVSDAREELRSHRRSKKRRNG